MDTDQNVSNDKQKSPAKRFLFIFGLVFLALYFILGLAVIFWKDFPLAMSQNYRIAFGILLIAYAGFRFSRIIKDHPSS